jgi:hypothetical protein
MKQSQKDRIRVDPAQAPIELVSAPVNGGEAPEWMEEMEQVLKTAESIYLQYKSGVLRFRRANHDGGKHKTFITLGNQDEMNFFAEENLQKIRYFYAQRRPVGAFFDVNTMISHKDNMTEKTKRLELPAHLDMTHSSGRPQFTFAATGSQASVDIIEWRGSVKEGEVGRFQPENTHLEISCRAVVRPFTLLHEDRVEFKNHSYTFGEKMQTQFDKMLKKRIAQLERERAEQEAEAAESESQET